MVKSNETMPSPNYAETPFLTYNDMGPLSVIVRLEDNNKEALVAEEIL